MKWWPKEGTPTIDEFCQAICVLVSPQDILAAQLKEGVDVTAPQLAARWAKAQLGKRVEIRSHTEIEHHGKDPGVKVYLGVPE